MNRLIELLNEKNHFLEKFCSLNERQIARLESGQIDDVDRFYQQREELLKIIKYIDTNIFSAHEQSKSASEMTLSEEHKNDIRDHLRIKESYVKKILDQDLIILGLIDDAKSQIIKELKEVQKAKKALAGYKPNAA